MAYYYNCSILASVIVVNLLLCLICNLTLSEVCTSQKRHSVYRVGYYLQFQASPGDKGELWYKYLFESCLQLGYTLSENKRSKDHFLNCFLPGIWEKRKVLSY